MLRRQTLWLPGLDHAGIGAQFVLDRIIAAEGESRDSLGRERYLERMIAYVATTRETILAQSRRLGSSLDWSRTRYTMDEVSSKAVRDGVHPPVREDLAYRTEALVNWCPGCRTSCRDLEVIPTPEIGTLWTIRYHLLDQTARPARRVDRRRHDPTRDDPRRRRGRGPSGRPTLRRARRPADTRPVRRARRADHRRPDRPAGIRDRGGQDHAGPRP